MCRARLLIPTRAALARQGVVSPTNAQESDHGPYPMPFRGRTVTHANTFTGRSSVSTDGKPHILAVGGGSFVSVARGGAAPGPLLRYALDLTGSDRPRICFLATAVGDGAEHIARLYDSFARIDAEVSHLSLFPMP